MIGRQTISLGAVFGVVLIVKLGLLAGFGPLFMADSHDYLVYARLILDGTDWLRHTDLHAPDITSFRMFGYPLVLAGALRLFGEQWAWAVVSVQTLVGVGAVTAVFAAARAMLQSERWAMAVAAAYGLSPALQFDLFILTDSFYGHFLALLTALIVLWWSRHTRPSMTLAAAAGLLLVPAFLLREATMPLGLVFAVPVLVWGWRGCGIRGIAVTLAFCAPLLITVGMVKAWNQSRTGTAFVTTGTRTALLLPLVSMAGRGEPVFEGHSDLDVVAREAMAASAFAPADYGIREALATNSALLKRGWSSLDITRAVDRKFFELVLGQPLVLARNFARKLTSEVLFLPFNPPRLLRELVMWQDTGEFEGIRRFVARLLAEKRGDDLLFAAVEAPARIIGLALVGAFLFAPLAILRRRGSSTAMILSLWVAAGAFSGAYLMVYVEPRYLIGVLPAALMVAASVLKPRAART